MTLAPGWVAAGTVDFDNVLAVMMPMIFVSLAVLGR